MDLKTLINILVNLTVVEKVCSFDIKQVFLSIGQMSLSMVLA